MACVNVWEVESLQTKAERQSYVFNILHNLLCFETPSLVASKPSSQASSRPAALAAAAAQQGVMLRLCVLQGGGELAGEEQV